VKSKANAIKPQQGTGEGCENLLIHTLLVLVTWNICLKWSQTYIKTQIHDIYRCVIRFSCLLIILWDVRDVTSLHKGDKVEPITNTLCFRQAQVAQKSWMINNILIQWKILGQVQVAQKSWMIKNINIQIAAFFNIRFFNTV